ncbi:MAG: single-stranded DNA-binding protein, partial [Minisyncoccia bacterium]
MDFNTLKTSHSNFDKLTKALEANLNPEDINKQSKDKYTDERIWKPELDKTGSGYAVIRFLPATEKEEMPWVRVWSHAFQDKGGWYIENSLTTLNQKDPVSEENTRLWNSGVESDKEIARKRKRKLSYYSNILVVSDPAHPENEGKVFIFKYGKKIFDKITEAMQPAFDDEQPINPFDFWKGANFKLKIRKVDGYWNYDKSEFEPVKAIAENDEKIKAIWSRQYALTPFLAPSNFKTYDELKEKLNRVI